MTQPRPPLPLTHAPYHALRSFNYLMQDAGIMPRRHLKEAPAFIYWDSSSVRTERRFTWVPCSQRCTHPSHSPLCLSVPFSFWLSYSHFLSLCPSLSVAVCWPEIWSHGQRWQVSFEGEPQQQRIPDVSCYLYVQIWQWAINIGQESVNIKKKK